MTLFKPLILANFFFLLVWHARGRGTEPSRSRARRREVIRGLFGGNQGMDSSKWDSSRGSGVVQTSGVIGSKSGRKELKTKEVWSSCSAYKQLEI